MTDMRSVVVLYYREAIPSQLSTSSEVNGVLICSKLPEMERFRHIGSRDSPVLRGLHYVTLVGENP